MVIDSKGFYATGVTTKYVAYEGSSNTASKYVVNGVVKSQNPHKKQYFKKLFLSSVDNKAQEIIFEDMCNMN